MVLVGVVSFIVLAWIFVLGILVGKGLIPEKIKRLSSLKQEILDLKKPGAGGPTEEKILNQEIKEPDFEFFKKLPEKKKIYTPPLEEKIYKKSGGPLHGAGLFTVQLASFDSANKAAALVKSLVKKGCKAYTHKAKINGKTFYRVRCGKFNTKEEALDYKKRLSKLVGLTGFVCRASD